MKHSAREQHALRHATTVVPAGHATRIPARLGWAVIVIAVAGAMTWAAMAPLDKGVPLSGTVVVAGNRKAVQHMAGGTVEAILVKEGDTVQAGDVLVKMNSVQARSVAEALRAQYLTARSQQSRLLAERDGLRQVAFPPELEQMRDDPRVASHLRMQQQLFDSRQAALRSELSALDENVAGLALHNRGLEQARDGKQLQSRLLAQQLDGVRDLAGEGYMPRNRLLELERTQAQLQTAIAEDTGNIGRGQRQIAEFRLRRLQRLQEHRKEVHGQLAEVQRDAEGLSNRLAGLDFEVGNTLVRAPATGVVVGINVFTNGGVVAPGFRMMDIVPAGDALVVDGQLPVHLVDKVSPDLPVELIFSAFNQNLTPHVPGVVTHVSADRLVDEKTGQPYYALKARVAPEGMRIVAGLQIRPGMPVDLFVKTGERTLLSYLMKPLLDHARMSMKEE